MKVQIYQSSVAHNDHFLHYGAQIISATGSTVKLSQDPKSEIAVLFSGFYFQFIQGH